MTDITVEVVAAPAIEVTVSPAGVPGMSAYQHAVAGGFVGTEAEWLQSLHGADSTVPGPPGPTAVSTDPGNAAVLGGDGLIYVPETGGGGGSWGEIAGTLSDQTDLQAALDAKADTADLGTAASADVGDFAAAVHTHTASQVADFDAEVSNNTDVEANTAARHTHANASVLDATTASFTTADETKLDGIASGATANSTDAALRDRSTHTGTQLASTISDFNTAADARVAAGITGKLDTSAAPELIRDTIGAALVAGTNITVTVNDAGDTITIAASGSSGQEVRHDTAGGYDYTGSAPVGTAESSSGWSVTRITLTSPPVVMTGTGTWTGRAGLTYS